MTPHLDSYSSLVRLNPPDPSNLALLPEEVRAVLALRGAAGVWRLSGDGEELQGDGLLHPKDLQRPGRPEQEGQSRQPITSQHRLKTRN